jgi:acyl dehydratase
MARAIEEATVTTTVLSVDELTALVGTHLGYSAWREVTQERVNTFADATDDHQWIHVDAERAAAGPFGTTIAHGFLTLSLLIPMWSEILRFDGVRLAINYGLNKVRFPSPVPVGSSIRTGATLVSVDTIADGSVQIVVDFVIEREGGEKPCCIAQGLYRFYI